MILGDIKRISHGLGKHKYGNVNLWGYEEPPTLDDKLEQTQKEITFIQEMLDAFNELDEFDKVTKLKTTIRIISCRIHDV